MSAQRLQEASSSVNNAEVGTGQAITIASHEEAEMLRHLKPDLLFEVGQDELIFGVSHPLARKILQIVPVNNRIPCPAKDCTRNYKAHQAFLNHVIKNHPGPLGEAVSELKHLRRPIIRRFFCQVGDQNALDCAFPENRQRHNNSAPTRKVADGTASPSSSITDSLSSRSQIFGIAAQVESNRMIDDSNAKIIESNRTIIELLTTLCLASGAKPRRASATMLPTPWNERPILRQWDETIAELTSIRSSMGNIAGTVATPPADWYHDVVRARSFHSRSL